MVIDIVKELGIIIRLLKVFVFCIICFRCVFYLGKILLRFIFILFVLKKNIYICFCYRFYFCVLCFNESMGLIIFR